jgi:hypothetical protein
MITKQKEFENAKKVSVENGAEDDDVIVVNGKENESSKSSS